MNKQEFTFTVTRIAYASREITVEAETEEEAHDLVMDEAGDHEYNEHSSDYEIDPYDLPGEKIEVDGWKKVGKILNSEPGSGTEYFDFESRD